MISPQIEPTKRLLQKSEDAVSLEARASSNFLCAQKFLRDAKAGMGAKMIFYGALSESTAEARAMRRQMTE
jgi:hypothetical protein